MKGSINAKRIVTLAAVSLIAALAVFVANEVLDSYIDESSDRRMLGLDYAEGEDLYQLEESLGSRILSVAKGKHRRAKRAKAHEMKVQQSAKRQHKQIESSSNFDPKSVAGKSYKDAEGVQNDGTYLILYDEFYEGPGNSCIPLVRAKDKIKRVHYHFSHCQLFDDMFGNRLGLFYGMKMIAHAMEKPFTFTCGLAEGETSIGAAHLMRLNSQADVIGPIKNPRGKNYTAKELCQRFCAGRFCNWYDSNLDLAADIMKWDWDYLTQPKFVAITDHDDAAIHLRLGDGLYSTYGTNEGKGVFPHGTYINLLKQVQEEKGAINSIGIITAPFKGDHLRPFDREFTSLSEVIAWDLMVTLKQEFPHADITLHNSPDGTIIESLARLVHARKVAICGCSTFCPYALLATKGIGYIHNSVSSMNTWVPNAAEREENVRLFDAPMLNGLMISNQKFGWTSPERRVLRWMREQDPNVGNVDIIHGPIFHRMDE